MVNDYWKGRQILVTGGTGFVGKNLVDKLLTMGSDVFVLTRKPENLDLLFDNKSRGNCHGIIGDLTGKNVLEMLRKVIREQRIQDVFHLAAQSIPRISVDKPDYTYSVNSQGTEKVLEACRQESDKIKSIVIASSINAYGLPRLKDLPLKEDSPFCAMSPYDASKASADSLASSYAKSYNLPIAIARCSNIYGGGDLNFDNRVVPKLFKCILTDEEFRLMGGSQKRDFFYVKDAVSAYLTLAEKVYKNKLIGEAFNFGSGNPVSLEELIKEIEDVTKSRLNLIRVPVNGTDPGDIYCSLEKAGGILEWKPQYALNLGLTETFIWYSKLFKRDG